MKRILYILSITLFLACNPDRLKVENQFAGTEEIAMWFKGEKVFTYNAFDHQTGYSEHPLRFWVCDDSMQDYFCVTLPGTEFEDGDELKADLQWTTSTDIKQKSGIVLKVLKKDSNTGLVWLWNRKSQTGAVVKVLSSRN